MWQLYETLRLCLTNFLFTVEHFIVMSVLNDDDNDDDDDDNTSLTK